MPAHVRQALAESGRKRAWATRRNLEGATKAPHTVTSRERWSRRREIGSFVVRKACERCGVAAWGACRVGVARVHAAWRQRQR